MSNTFFRERSAAALQDSQLQAAMDRVGKGFSTKRSEAISQITNFESLKTSAQRIKAHSLQHLPEYLSQFEEQVIQQGGKVHWAETPTQFNQIIVDICNNANATRVAKGKSMVSEETCLNEALEKHQINVIETDLGEYIIQLAGEKPSHIIAPASHKTKTQVSSLFKQHHALGDRPLTTTNEMVAEARKMLRERFLEAQVGITGANFLIAETGETVLVTNEGNGDLSANLPPVHIVTASIEKVIPNRAAVAPLLNVLARSATGQTSSSYTSFFGGPARADDKRKREFHVVLLDNGRSDILNSEYNEILNCIKCGACLNHCPVYLSVGGHSYDSVYPGPMGSIFSPLLATLNQSDAKQDAYLELANASTFCGRCAEVCPMGIPIPDLLRKLREKSEQMLPRSFLQKLIAGFQRIAQRPAFYHLLNRMLVPAMYLGAPLLNGVRRRRDQRPMPIPEQSAPFLSNIPTKNKLK